MKLIELAEEYFKGNHITGICDMGDVLTNKFIFKLLLMCEDFENVEVLEYINKSIMLDKNEKQVYSETYKLADIAKFGKKCYIRNITITPELYDPSAIFTPVKDGAYITPVVFRLSDFSPYKQICIEFSPEEFSVSDKLLEVFTKVLKSPEEYQIKGKRDILISGVFDEITLHNGNTIKRDFDELDFDCNKYFYVSHIETSEFGCSFNRVPLPIKFKEQYVKKFGNVFHLNKVDLDKFIESQYSVPSTCITGVTTQCVSISTDLYESLLTGNSSGSSINTSNTAMIATGILYHNSNGTSNINLWSHPERINVIENNDSIEMIYKETSTISYTSFPAPPPEVRVFKIIFSCVDGKWNKSDRIYGEIIPASDESYEFES